MMVESLKKILPKPRREFYPLPKSVQETIPVQRLWKDGIFQSGKSCTKTFRFEDINYQIAGNDAQSTMFLNYSKVLNSFGCRQLCTDHNS